MKIYDVLERTGDYESVSLWHSLPNYPVFGGQIVAQALNVAYKTVENGLVARSLHANFLAPAYNNIPIIYKVDNVRNGKTLKNREIRAFQNDKLLFIANISLSAVNNNILYEYQKYKLKKDISFITLNDLIKEKIGFADSALYNIIVNHLEYLYKHIGIEIGDIDKNKRVLRFRSRKSIQNVADYSCFIAFMSDFFLLESGLLLFDIHCFSNEIKFFTSVDHSIHFFDLSAISDVLYVFPECHRISGDRFFCREKIFDNNGILIAEATQEGIIRFSEDVKML